METLLGIGALILIVGFAVFAFRQGTKVKKPPQGVPSEDAATLYAASNLDNVNRP